MARPTFGEDNPKAWAASDLIGGSPGRLETAQPTLERQVVINEIYARPEPGAEDFIELYNHGASPVDLSGWWLSDNPDTNRFRLPEGTILGPTSFVYFTESVLGFGLAAEGEGVYLVNSNRTRVIDAIIYAGQETGLSSGRYPDGAPEFGLLSARTPGAANQPERVHDLVINEIMYNPVSRQDDDEYVEIYNCGSQAVSLAGWRLGDGIDFTFPAGAVIPADGFVVAAKNAARLLNRYPQLNLANCYGNYSGNLRNSGERLELSRPEFVVTTNAAGQPRTNLFYIPVDEVTYGEGGRWGRWADGGGSSLELTDPRSDNRRPSNWADSDDTAKSLWTYLTHTGLLDNSSGSNWNSLQIYLHEAGEVLVDDVYVSISNSVNLVSNPGFESGLTDWFGQGNHYRIALAEEGYQSARSLWLRASGRGDTGANRVRTTLLGEYTNNLTGTISARVKWLHGKPEVLFRLRGNHLELAGSLETPPDLGTPGARNSRWAANVGPAIWEVGHQPVLPAAGQPVTVTARLQDPDGLTEALVYYRLDPAGATLAVPLNDQGVEGDLAPGDGIYSAQIPGQTNGALVAFYVQAADGYSPPATSRFPHDAPRRECLVRFGEASPSPAFGAYRFWLTKTNFDAWVAREKLSNEPIEGTFVYNNCRVIYNAGNQYAGSPYHSPNYNSPLGNNCDYYLTLPPDDAFLNATEFTLQMPGNGGGDSTCQGEQTAYWIADQLGAPFLYRRLVNVYLNGTRRGILFEDTQQPNRDFAEQWWPDAADGGDLYKVMIWFEMTDTISAFTSVGASLQNFLTTGGAKKLARYRQNFGKRALGGESASNYTNLFELVDILNTNVTGADYLKLVLPAVDTREWSRAFATERIVGNTDLYANGGGQNCYIYKPAGGPWQFLIWDIDFAFATQLPTYNLFNFTDAPITKLFSQTVVLRQYWQALYEAANGPLDPAKANRLLNARYAAYQGAGISAIPPTNIQNFISIRREFIRGLLAESDKPLAITSNGGQSFTNNSTVLALTGTAPFAADRLAINGVEYPLTWTGLNQWAATISLTGQTNVIQLQALDSQGQILPDEAPSLTVYFNGQVARPEESLVISEIMFQPAISNAHYVEIFNRSTNTTFDLRDYRLRGVDFDFSPGTLLAPGNYLVVVKNLAAFQTAYPAYASNAFVAGTFPGNLDPDGERLTLLRSGPAPGQETIINRVRYGAAAPWPSGPASPGQGAALQLVDAAQDNARVSNWADDTDWKFFSYTGTPGQTRFYFYLNTAGEVYLDDIRLVAGASAGVGSNLLVNGDFELPLDGTWLVTPLRPYAAESSVSTRYVRSGAQSLRLVFTNAGSTLAYMYQDLTNIVTTATHTMSFWYLPSTNAQNLTMRMGSFFRPTISVQPIAATPGASNSVAGLRPAYPQLWVNEVMPENPDGLADQTGAPQPWIELFNSGASALSLDGFCLANQFTNLSQWAFPTGAVIGPGEFKVIFASGREELSTGGFCHTSFRLDPTNGQVALSRQGLLLDYVQYAGLPARFAYGDWPDGQLFDRQVFYYPTPGASNNPAPVPVALNEWLASNTNGLVNPATGRFDDWFELFNFGPQPLDLSGYYLTDDLANPRKWRVPDGVTIPARGWLLVWADDDLTGTNRLGNALHVNFQLSRTGESLGLFSPEGIPVDTVTFGSQSPNVSQGRFPDGHPAAQFVFMPAPTPGSANTTNATAGPSLAPIPDFTVAEHEPLEFVVAVSPAGPWQFTLLPGAPPGAFLNPTNGAFAWTPGELDGGSNFVIGVRVQNSQQPDQADTRLFSVAVQEVNSPPALAPLTNLALHAGASLRLWLSATDPDWPANTLTFSLPAAPPGAALDPSSGLLTWTATNVAIGAVLDFTVAVTDNGSPNLQQQRGFQVAVAALPRVDAFRLAGGQVTLSWNALPGAHYRAQSAPSPLGPWEDLPGEIVPLNSVATLADPVGDRPQRFYRLLVAP